MIQENSQIKEDIRRHKDESRAIYEENKNIKNTLSEIQKEFLTIRNLFANNVPSFNKEPCEEAGLFEDNWNLYDKF